MRAVQQGSACRQLSAQLFNELLMLLDGLSVELAGLIERGLKILDLLITDVGLPGLNGRQIAEIARQHRPNLKILFVTGYAEHATGHAPFLEPGMEMVTKPFALDALALKIREMIHE